MPTDKSKKGSKAAKANAAKREARLARIRSQEVDDEMDFTIDQPQIMAERTSIPVVDYDKMSEEQMNSMVAALQQRLAQLPGASAPVDTVNVPRAEAPPAVMPTTCENNVLSTPVACNNPTSPVTDKLPVEEEILEEEMPEEDMLEEEIPIEDQYFEEVPEDDDTGDDPGDVQCMEEAPVGGVDVTDEELVKSQGHCKPNWPSFHTKDEGSLFVAWSELNKERIVDALTKDDRTGIASDVNERLPVSLLAEWADCNTAS